ncbi:hypothetical protein SDC9_70305 [bioreactor metagenome]|uniref:RNA polymerase sigma-70 region 2 domain-containing protein n=1 Tax=bioreactor metagenome TaxID=1076179 RepID=A0A644Y7A7_9ZZZZ
MAYTITDAQAVVIDRIARSLVGKQVKNHFIPESDKEDYVQELLLIMVQHQVDWNVPEKVCFETFVTMVMKKRLISIWREFHAEKEILSYASSLNIIQRDEDGQDEELVDELAENGTLDDASLVFHEEKQRMLRHDIPAFLKTLPDDEREVCELLMQYGLRRTANIMGKHKFTITRKIHRIRRKMIAVGFEAYL